ncbi:hypothetical protein [Flammeovirga aprica]|uniref:Uncharacterized protein n=1 Tax=Flammeovirga aprica JL-4 TaxID=694437 RepID=A0A7X9RZE4_9BACT|nr:hypothetical protein [Flammeovirga aprica]NME71612.1 hypothetical protein [Flammeovirga aprica JL-4]
MKKLIYVVLLMISNSIYSQAQKATFEYSKYNNFKDYFEREVRFDNPKEKQFLLHEEKSLEDKVCFLASASFSINENNFLKDVVVKNCPSQYLKEVIEQFIVGSKAYWTVKDETFIVIPIAVFKASDKNYSVEKQIKFMKKVEKNESLITEVKSYQGKGYLNEAVRFFLYDTIRCSRSN